MEVLGLHEDAIAEPELVEDVRAEVDLEPLPLAD